MIIPDACTEIKMNSEYQECNVKIMRIDTNVNQLTLLNAHIFEGNLVCILLLHDIHTSFSVLCHRSLGRSIY